MSERKEGMYWVKEIDHPHVRWQTAEWDRGQWWSTDNLLEWQPLVIGDRIPTPDEPWQCVPAAPDDAMAEACRNGLKREFGDCHRGTLGYYKRIIKRALAAAPKP